jgi:hypothetical protein
MNSFSIALFPEPFLIILLTELPSSVKLFVRLNIHQEYQQFDFSKAQISSSIGKATSNDASFYTVIDRLFRQAKRRLYICKYSIPTVCNFPFPLTETLHPSIVTIV